MNHTRTGVIVKLYDIKNHSVLYLQKGSATTPHPSSAYIFGTKQSATYSVEQLHKKHQYMNYCIKYITVRYDVVELEDEEPLQEKYLLLAEKLEKKDNVEIARFLQNMFG